MDSNYAGIYKGKTVLVTGHTGFKGSWLSLWLNQLGAKVVGYALAPATEPSHFMLAAPDMVSVVGDLRDRESLEKVFKNYKPEVVFHMAAQPLVRCSYSYPVETYEVNVIGTLNVFEASRRAESVRAIVNVTSDKCYENREWDWGYREIDPMGGYDPYSSSKGCAELLTSSYQRSFFSPEQYGKAHQCLLASVRAGNVVGGGDWALDRLIPDAVHAAHKNEKVVIRNPKAIRPWQHVLEPLNGYLMVGQKLLEGQTKFSSPWNFGPESESCVTVETVLTKMKKYWSEIDFSVVPSDLHEATFLKLDSSKAKNHLGWQPCLGLEETLEMTTQWYRDFYSQGKVATMEQIGVYRKAVDGHRR